MRHPILHKAVLCAVFLGFCTPAPAQDSVQHAAATTTKKIVKTVRRTAKQVAKKSQAVAKQTAYTVAAVLRNLPTPGWAQLRAAYDYKTTPNVKEEPQENSDAVRIHLSFTGANGKPVEGIFERPKADGVYPCVFLLHGLTNDKEIALQMYGKELLAKGLAILALDAPEHGENRVPGKNLWTKQVIMTAVHEGDRNYRLALDYLATRKDVDNARIGLVGYSLGSIMGSILGAVDNRVSAFALCVGGDPFLPIARVMPAQERGRVFKVCPSLYIAHVSPRPILMLNGKEDVVIVPPAAYLLQNSAKQPKQIAWYNGGHDVPQNIRVKAVDWIADKLKAQATSSLPDNAGAVSSARK